MLNVIMFSSFFCAYLLTVWLPEVSLNSSDRSHIYHYLTFSPKDQNPCRWRLRPFFDSCKPQATDSKSGMKCHPTQSCWKKKCFFFLNVGMICFMMHNVQSYVSGLCFSITACAPALSPEFLILNIMCNSQQTCAYNL